MVGIKNKSLYSKIPVICHQVLCLKFAQMSGERLQDHWLIKALHTVRRCVHLNKFINERFQSHFSDNALMILN